MIMREPDGPVSDIVRSAVEPRGYRVVECAVQTVRRRTQVHIVLHHENGINLDVLGEIHAGLVPEIETVLGEEGPHIEFSSPGIDRTFKSCHEFSVFSGLRARVLSAVDGRWIAGRIVGLEDDVAILAGDDAVDHRIRCDQIQKALLEG